MNTSLLKYSIKQRSIYILSYLIMTIKIAKGKNMEIFNIVFKKKQLNFIFRSRGRGQGAK